MKEDYCGTCQGVLRYPETAKTVVCQQCNSDWVVVRTGSMMSLAPPGTMQMLGTEETLQKKLKDIQRQILIKDDHCRSLREDIESIVIEFQPVPIALKIGAALATLFFLAGAAGAWFFKQPVVLPGALVLVSIAPIVGATIYKRQINQRERAKLFHKRELIGELAALTKEIGGLKEEKDRVREDTVFG